MRILYVVDGRSPIALNWINYFVETGHQVHLVSTFRCQPEQPFASLNVIPVAFSSAKPGGTTKSASKKKGGIWGASTVRLRTSIRHWLGPVTLPRAARRLREVIARIEPDLIHAMRIPYEGMLSALAEPNTPLLISVWGNDFTLHAPATPWMRHYTRLALKHANALHADCQRDIRLAQTWGFPADRPTTVLPGAGGLQPEIFYPPATAAETREGTREANATVINPRGIRAYVRNDTFFRSIPLVLAKRPEVRFLCPTMANELSAQRWLDELSIRE